MPGGAQSGFLSQREGSLKRQRGIRCKTVELKNPLYSWRGEDGWEVRGRVPHPFPRRRARGFAFVVGEQSGVAHSISRLFPKAAVHGVRNPIECASDDRSVFSVDPQSRLEDARVTHVHVYESERTQTVLNVPRQPQGWVGASERSNARRVSEKASHAACWY
jgi:hypothetical protein